MRGFLDFLVAHPHPAAWGLRISGPRCGKMKRVLASSTPRSSNGRTAAFGAVNRGSNPCRGATPSAYQLHHPIILTAAPVATVARIRHIPQVLALRAFSPVANYDLRGGALNPRG